MTTEPKFTKDFTFKQFTIHGGLSGMPVSTDSVLLGSWILVDSKETLNSKEKLTGNTQDVSILDIGTGTGLLSLMCAQRFPKAEITAIEINKAACDAAQINFNASPWQSRLTLRHVDILQWDNMELFQTIICNPPYFNHGAVASSENRAQARHTLSLSHTNLLDKCQQLVTKTGYANFILPYNEGISFIALAKHKGWCVTRLCKVSPTEKKPVNRLLIELSLRETDGICEESTLTIYNNGQYSAEFIELTKTFYLKMPH